MSADVVLLSACRIPTGKFGGVLSQYTAPQLGAFAIREAVKRAGVSPNDIEEVIMGNVVSAGVGQAPARQAALRAGLPPHVNAMTINKVCGSGLKAVALAAQAIKAGDLSLAVAGGMESMSNAPYLAEKARWGARLGNARLIDSVVFDGLWCSIENIHMGETAELVAEKYGISRKEQDEFAFHSHQKAIKAQKEGKFKEEIVPVEVLQKGGSFWVEKDEPPREDTSVEALSKLKPAFRENGTVTAGNAPGLNDGASALVVASMQKAQAINAKPIGRILGYQSAGIEPKWVMMAPVDAVKILLQKLKMSIDDFDLIELNEAFSVQAIAVMRELRMDPGKVNVHGGAVALGHPIGASGARILTTLLYALKTYNKKLGLAALCLGGGNAVAMAVERL
jgi:acetyl-CoA C-acetyltransferase